MSYLEKKKLDPRERKIQILTTQLFGKAQAQPSLPQTYTFSQTEKKVLDTQDNQYLKNDLSKSVILSSVVILLEGLFYLSKIY